MKCVACGAAETEMGFIPDVGTAQTWVALWVAGSPSTSKGLWERMRSGGGVSLNGQDVKAIEARRCLSCGYLMLFANRAPGAGESLVSGS